MLYKNDILYEIEFLKKSMELIKKILYSYFFRKFLFIFMNLGVNLLFLFVKLEFVEKWL